MPVPPLRRVRGLALFIYFFLFFSCIHIAILEYAGGGGGRRGILFLRTNVKRPWKTEKRGPGAAVLEKPTTGRETTAPTRAAGSASHCRRFRACSMSSRRFKACSLSTVRGDRRFRACLLSTRIGEGGKWETAERRRVSGAEEKRMEFIMTPGKSWKKAYSLRCLPAGGEMGLLFVCVEKFTCRKKVFRFSGLGNIMYPAFLLSY